MSARGLWQRWVRFWDRREGPESLALVRILIGGVLLWDLVEIALHGLIPEIFLAPPRGLGWAAGEQGWPLSTMAGSELAVFAVWAAALAGAFGVALGVALRPAAFTCALAWAFFARVAPDGDRGIDLLLRIVLLVLAFSDADAVWSLHRVRERRRGRPAPEVIPAWPRLLLFGQLVWLYSSVSQNRSGIAWWPWGGSVALAHVLSDPHWARFSPDLVPALAPLTRVGTVLTMLFELGSPLLVLFTWLDRDTTRQGSVARAVRRFRLRWVWIGLGASLHLGIAVSMSLGIFPFGMLALYPALFAPEELRALGRRLLPLSAKASPYAAREPG